MIIAAMAMLRVDLRHLKIQMTEVADYAQIELCPPPHVSIALQVCKPVG
jgi:hypothetical protein